MDVDARLADADKMGVDVQVVYPTLFIAHLTDDPVLDVALAKAYNRWLADAHSRGGDRLRWVCILPSPISPPASSSSTGRASEAPWDSWRGIEGERRLAEPHFFPVYEEQAASTCRCIIPARAAGAISSVLDNRIGG